MAGLLDIGLQLAGGLMSTFGAAKQAKVNARLGLAEYTGQWQQVGIQNQQLLDEMEAVDKQAALAVAQRYEQAQKIKTRNLSWMTSSGTSYNASQAVAARETDKSSARDANTIGYNAALKEVRIADQIKINRMGLDTALSRAAAGISQGTAKTIGVAEQAAVDIIGSLIKDASGIPGMTK